MQSTHHLVSRRQFLIASALGFGGSLLALNSAVPAAAAAPAFGISAQQLRRAAQRNLIMAGWWRHWRHTDLGNFTTARHLAPWVDASAPRGFYNMPDDQFIPWLAEGTRTTPITRSSRSISHGVEWSDGQPFTARTWCSRRLAAEEPDPERGGFRHPAPGRQRRRRIGRW
jgi:ABC-type transport system substrate-binding protein